MQEARKKDTKKNIKKGIKAIWRHIQPFKGTLSLLFILGVISAVSNGFVPYLTGRFFDALIGFSENKTELVDGSIQLWVILLTVWAIIQLVANNIDWIMDRVKRRMETDLTFNIQTDGFVHLFLLPLNYHKNAHTNADMQKISMASWRVSMIVGMITNLAPQFLSIIIGISLAASINMMMAGILLIGVILYVALLIKILIPIAEIDSVAHKSWNEGWDDAAASVQQVESVKQATGEHYETEKVKSNLLIKTRNLWMKLERHWSNVSFFQRTIVFVTQLSIFILSVGLISKGSISVGQLVALNGYSLMFFGPFVSLGYNWQIIQNGITTAGNVEKIFEEKEEIYKPSNSYENIKIEGNVKFENVYFKYSTDQPEILHGIDFEVKKGSVVALVGESGVGKSTSVHLISGYYFPTKGNVFIDNYDTRKIDLITLRKNMAVVPQEVALFNDTIMNNIRYGSFDISDEEVKRVAKDAHIDDFVQTLPEGYGTIVGERGIKLSVGQKQRIAIARAMLRNPTILILDEPTSALDAQTEKIVTESLERLMKGRTTFIIAHRLSTVRKADMILVFQKGSIVEKGQHHELIKIKDGVYKRLYDYQIGLH